MTTIPGYDTCKHCGTIHGPLCPFVKAIEYHPDGAVKRIEFVERASPALPINPILPVNPWPLFPPHRPPHYGWEPTEWLHYQVRD